MAKSMVLLDVALPDFLEALFTPHCELVPWTLLESGDDRLTGVAGIFSYSHALVGDRELDRLPGLKAISNYGVGVDHIDVQAAARRGLSVGYTPGTTDAATADLTMALMLAAARNLVIGDHYARGPDFLGFDPGHMLGRDVFGATLGIVGMGRIGTAVAKRARGFDMQILYHNRRRDEAAEKALSAAYSELDTLLAKSDFVSINVPLSDETRNLIGERELRRMRPDAYLINTARGGVVDHDALLRALRENWIAAAAIDVTEPEPLPRDHPLLGLDNLVITPHLGTSTYGTRLRMGEMARDNLLAGLAGEPVPVAVPG